MAMEDMKSGKACAETTNLHNHCVSGPYGQFVVPLSTCHNVMGIVYEHNSKSEEKTKSILLNEINLFICLNKANNRIIQG